MWAAMSLCLPVVILEQTLALSRPVHVPCGSIAQGQIHGPLTRLSLTRLRTGQKASMLSIAIPIGSTSQCCVEVRFPSSRRCTGGLICRTFPWRPGASSMLH